jgi:UDP-glucose 4-epimerase
LIWEACGNDPSALEFRHVESFEVDVQRRWPSTDKARRVLGWEAEIDLRDGLTRTAGWLGARLSRTLVG